MNFHLSEICTVQYSKSPLKFPRPKHAQIRIADHTYFKNDCRVREHGVNTEL